MTRRRETSTNLETPFEDKERIPLHGHTSQIPRTELLGKLMSAELIRKFPAFYGT
jgi:hypothetical protein